ncbi:hypothetical protein KMZ29_10130 [Bradyrhizobium sediminis]|uniref:Bll5862 protein n=1 Tax=Bradyrhizobium sediminis TaxID=2840469 RepID=A0A975NI55_9BRAD|nr:hypothetical protein [Bradyrhizobium sediminis]QWG14976.1 hypothetical protein KMZ29_10130 [Bradyrhizobium sediminis]
MPEPLQDHPTASQDDAPATRYAYKASLIGSAHQFELTDEGLKWKVGSRSGVWPYADITAVRLTYRPMSMQPRRFRADIERKDRQRVAILSTSWQTVTLMAPQDREYSAFIAQLHERMKQAGSKAALIGGIKPGLYAAGVALVALVAVAITGLLARAIATGEYGGALFLVGFAALFGWQIGGFIQRNRPQSYTFDHLPQALLP